MKVALLHCYSSENLGDGLLVDNSIQLIRDALGDDVVIDVVAGHPESFEYLDVATVPSMPKRPGQAVRYLALLRSLPTYDLVVGVGGGYLRFGTLAESVKTTIVHLPQLLAAARAGDRAVYLPQSVGPWRWQNREVIGRLLSRLNVVFLRDDRSLADLAARRGSRRTPDLAILSGALAQRDRAPVVLDTPTVLSVRRVHGEIPTPVRALATRLEPFDGYIQSVVGANNDVAPVNELGPTKILTTRELLGTSEPGFERRVVVAMRLHAALMALRAGHYVVHLAYERKGFGAFADLGLDRYVFNCNDFDPDDVLGAVEALHRDFAVREDYDAAISARTNGFRGDLEDIRLALAAAARPAGRSEQLT